MHYANSFCTALLKEQEQVCTRLLKTYFFLLQNIFNPQLVESVDVETLARGPTARDMKETMMCNIRPAKSERVCCRAGHLTALVRCPSAGATKPLNVLVYV